MPFKFVHFKFVESILIIPFSDTSISVFFPLEKTENLNVMDGRYPTGNIAHA